MNRKEKLESLQLYLESMDRLPDEALRQGVSVYEMRTVMQIILELLQEE